MAMPTLPEQLEQMMVHFSTACRTAGLKLTHQRTEIYRQLLVTADHPSAETLHKRLLPACMFGGAILLMLCDLLARTIVSPTELPIGVITSLIGAALFVYIFYSTRRKGHA